jgi:hypothetical protein
LPRECAARTNTAAGECEQIGQAKLAYIKETTRLGSPKSHLRGDGGPDLLPVPMFIFSFTRNRRRWFSRTRLSTSSWTRCPILGERRQSSAGCTIPAGKYSSACGCLYYCSSERLKQHSQKSTLGDRSALCSAMAGVSSLMATKSSGGYLERRRLESKTRSAAPRANFRLWPKRS